MKELDTRLKVMKIKQDRKLLQMKIISDKVKQAEKWNEEKIIDLQVKERFKNIQDSQLDRLKQDVY
jgi:hypothetical protein